MSEPSSPGDPHSEPLLAPRAEPTAPAAALRLEWTVDPCVNFAAQQNGVAIVKELVLHNDAERELRDVVVRLRSEPPFATPCELRIDTLAPRSVHPLSATSLSLSASHLAVLDERLVGELHAEASVGGEVAAAARREIAVLAYDQWGGARVLPELLAAFVLPNHPAVGAWLRDAAQALERWTSDPSLSGYESRSRERVARVAAAVHQALQAGGVTYVHPPASFEQEGQKVRTPDRIARERMATCLDIALAAAACLEQAGLNALLVVVRGHAFCGVWLDEQTFMDPTLEDGALLTKRIELGEILVFDPTLATSRPAGSFEQAVEAARAHLEDPRQFGFVVDVARSRKGGIRPLPLRGHGAPDPDEIADANPTSNDAPNVELPARAQLSPSDETPANRIERWKRRLLDLTGRNRLLNFRRTKKTLAIAFASPSDVEDQLAEGRKLAVRPRLAEMRDALEAGRPLEHAAMRALAQDELRAGRLLTDLAETELDARSIEIYRAAREGLEEGGASGLYAALGFLEWYESPTSTAPRLAPLVLLPLEVERPSVRTGCRFSRGADETRFNTTLLEMLRVDHGIEIGGLDPLPADENGVDVPAVLQAVRLAIRDVPRWRVLDEVQIGFFTFAKFLMWKDLDGQADVLMRNPVVAHLVHSAGAAFDPQWIEPTGEELDDRSPTSSLFCPALADSSQLAAVVAAARGKSFVLEGPPGTGKSQTITNLIAHCLAEGKTVLFVSEKTAALEVVFKRLKHIGLERFCLELHSNKASKLRVVNDLGASLAAAQSKSPQDWEATAAELDRVRAELNAYARAAGRVHANGLSAFRAVSLLCSLRDAPSLALECEGLELRERAVVDRMRAELRDVESALRATGEPAGHALRGVTLEDAPVGFQDRASRTFTALRAARGELLESGAAIAAALGVEDLDAATGEALDRLERALRLAESAPPSGVKLLEKSGAEARALVDSVVPPGRRRDELRAALAKDFDLRLVELDLLALRGRIREASSSWFFSRWLQTRALRKTFASVAANAGALGLDSMGAAVERALELRDVVNALRERRATLDAAAGAAWSSAEAPWDEIEAAQAWCESARESLKSPHHEQRLAAWLVVARAAGRDAAKEASAIRSRIDAARDAARSVADLLALERDDPWLDARAPERLRSWSARLDEIEPALHGLRAWALWRRLRRRVVDSGLAALVRALESGRVRSTEFVVAFDRSYYEAWLAHARKGDRALHDFMGSAHDLKIERFRELDERCRDLSRKVVAARLSAAAPSRQGASAAPGSELGVLQRQIQLQRGHLGLRQLFRQTRTLVQRVKPCFLMSPISVAQYLPPGQLSFDVVVFDEASQIPTWDAVGAIARGAQAVVVGDSKQLPPTSFFDAVLDEDELEVADEGFEELESILEECRAAGVPPLDLRWHYRSRHESLIAFSNRKYYDNRLQTFPAALAEGLGVQWRPVKDGVYDRSRSRTNDAEARALVDEVLRRLRDPELAQFSMGVVTFSAAQQGKVEDLLDLARLEDPALEPYFTSSLERPEHVFVKNLENVQGDERDVILFSICYGPDETGRVSMNFGPLNQQGGQRRLNVAVTRARRELIVFSTLTADQIDLSRTRARGVADLRTFLAYAQHGIGVLPAETTTSDEDEFESPLELEVAQALRERGYEVHSQIGCAGYRIDLAVVHPDLPGRYLAGVECDGRNYHSARTARDRDMLRQSVLEGLGWRLLRVWSSEWWEDREAQLERLCAALESARIAPPSAPRPALPAPVEHAAQLEPELAAPSEPQLPRYSEHRLRKRGDQQAFYEAAHDARVAAAILEVVEAEGPIRLELAATRVAAAYGYSRKSQNAVQRVDDLARLHRVTRTEHGERVFLWPRNLDPLDWRGFRTSSPETDDARDAGDLPPEEVANGAAHLLATNGVCPRRDLQRALSRLFGFKALGSNVAARLDEGVEHLVRSGRASASEDERIELV